MQGLLKSSLLAVASGAKIRIGFAKTREWADHFLTHKVDVGDYFGHYVPVVDLNLQIAESLLQLLGKGDGKLPVEFSLPSISAAASQKVRHLLEKPPYKRNEISVEIAPTIARQPAASVLFGEKGFKAPSTPRVPSTPGVPLTPGAPSTASNSNGPQRVCAIIPGTTWTTKIWPEEKWLELCERLSSEFDYQLVFVGSCAEQKVNARLTERLNSILAKPNAVDLTGQTTLLELAALFEMCEMAIGADTGPLHLAAAVGKPKVLGIYGSTPWRRNGPYGEQCSSVALGIWCQPCYAKSCALGNTGCLTNLTADKVFAAARELQLIKNCPES
jgi:ADP-heptose:LPS heptosyltransferase